MIAAFSSLPSAEMIPTRAKGRNADASFAEISKRNWHMTPFQPESSKTVALVSRELPPESCPNLRNRAC
jgi:hypothetical protein